MVRFAKIINASVNTLLYIPNTLQEAFRTLVLSKIQVKKTPNQVETNETKKQTRRGYRTILGLRYFLRLTKLLKCFLFLLSLNVTNTHLTKLEIVLQPKK